MKVSIERSDYSPLDEVVRKRVVYVFRQSMKKRIYKIIYKIRNGGAGNRELFLAVMKAVKKRIKQRVLRRRRYLRSL